MNIGDFLSSIAKQAGIAEDSESFVKVMANKELATADFPDDLATEIQSKLLTLEAAKNNSDLIGEFKAKTLNAVDERLYEHVEKYGLGEDFTVTLKATKGTYNRMDAVAEGLKKSFDAQIEEAKNKTDDPKAKERLDALQTEVNSLNGDLAKFKESHMPIKDFEEMRDGFEDVILDSGLTTLLSDYKYIDPINPTMAKTLFDQDLIDLGLQVVNKEGKFILEKTDGTEYFDEQSKKIDLKGFMDSRLAHHRLLETTAKTDPVKTNGFSTDPVKVADDAPKGLAAGVELMRKSNDAAIEQLTKT